MSNGLSFNDAPAAGRGGDGAVGCVSTRSEDSVTVVPGSGTQSCSNIKDLEAGITPSESFIVGWAEGDPENPLNWSKSRKWIVTVATGSLTVLSTSGCSIIASGYDSMSRDLGSSPEENALTLTVYTVGFAVAPLLLASLSEEFGRRPMYICTTFMFTLLYLGVALAKNIWTVIIIRFFQGCAGSTGTTMVAGTLADIWATNERGNPMALYSFLAVLGTGLGPVITGWVELYLGWRWIEWIWMILSGLVTVLVVACGAQETRGSILLIQRAARLRKETGDDRYQTSFSTPDIQQLLWVSATRPLYLLLTEPIVASFAIWVGFAWGILYGLVQSISLVFQSLYDFNAGQSGTIFLSLVVGSIVGFALNFYQERLYSRNVQRVGPEARLYAACLAGLTLGIGAFIYAWTSYSYVPWIAPCIGIAIITASMFCNYLCAFNYLADAYSIYASSALAGQSLLRNLMGAVFPLFTDQMYRRLGFNWASSLLGFIALALAPIPIVLFLYGPTIRAKSRFAQTLAAKEKA